MVSNFFTLKKLTGAKQNDSGSTFQKMTDILGATEAVPGKFQFQILKGEEPSYFHIEAGKKTAKLHAKQADQPDFEIITTEDTWLEIASGSLSPLRAFLQNKMRIRGDVAKGELFLKQFSEPEKKSK